jgi:hypothetical protein
MNVKLLSISRAVVCKTQFIGIISIGVDTEELNFLSESDKDWIMGRSIIQRLNWV